MSLPLDLGHLGVDAPATLLALLALPLFVVLARRYRLAAVCRALAATALVLVLAGLHRETEHPASGLCLVAAVDGSASVRDAAAQTARAFLGDLVPRLGPEDRLGSLVFGGEARVVARPEPAPALSALVPGDLDAPAPEDTDLAAALARATPLCPAGAEAAVVLFTDGNETVGSLLAEVALSEPRVPVHAVVPPPAALPPVAIRRLLTPALAPAQTVLPLEVVVENRLATDLTAMLRVTANGRPISEEPGGRSGRLVPVRLPPGVSVAALPYRPDVPGEYLLEVELLLPPDVPPTTGPLTAALTVTTPLGALVVSDREAPVVAAALAERGMSVEVVRPAELRGRSAALDRHHLVVLDDVARADLDPARMAALAAWVARGGALVATGGAHLFGDPGFLGSPLERLLPVELQSQAPEPREREPIALYLVIDRSNSMGYTSGPGQQFGDKMEYARRAALAVLEQLAPGDLVGAIAFDSRPYELGALRSVAEGRPALASQIQRLRYGGGTDFKEALEIALDGLRAAERRVRHVILLTDGDTNRRAEDHFPVIDDFVRADITVTTIRIGSDTGNLELLHAISRATGGQFHHIERVQALPQLMISDARRLIDTASGHLGAPVHLGTPGPILAGFTERELPPVARWAVVRAKPGAEVRLYVEADDRRHPLLATWRYALGRAAAVPLDFQAGAASWGAWGGFGKLWTQLAVWAAPEGRPGDRHLELRRSPAGVVVSLRTLGDDPGPFALRLADGPEVTLRPSGRRTFTAVVPGLAAGLHPATLRTGGRTDPLDLVVPERTPSGRERRGAGPNRALLERVAALTGGTVDPAPADVLRARPGTHRRRTSLDGLLVPLAIVLVLADVAQRRLGAPR